jgi:SAM-dependent methyltransferase
MRIGGPFSNQGNNDTRAVEYPWAYFEASPSPGLAVVEIGGALSGFQFVLSRSGCRVTNIDPGEQDQDYWELALRLNDVTMQRLNRVFGTDVQFLGCTLQEAALPIASVDRVISISTIEHIPPEQLPDLAREMARILRPGGFCILTIDLFLDLAPFTDKEQNAYGRNIDVRSLVDASGLTLVKGDTSRLVGFDDCDPIGILRDLGEYFIGTGYPVCAQALVLEK